MSALSLNWPRGTTPNLDRVTSGLLGDDLRSGGRPGAASGLGHGKAFLGGGGLPHSWLLSFLPKHKTAAADAEPAARWRYVQRAGCWFAVWAMLHTRARGADCLSIRPWEGGKLLGRRRRRCGGGGAAVRLGVGGGREEGRRARSVLPAASLRRKTCASASRPRPSQSVFLFFFLLLPTYAADGYVSRSLQTFRGRLH